VARGTTTRVDFSATDKAGLTTSVPAMLTVIDPNTAPVVTAPAPDPLIITVPAGTLSVPASDPTIAAWIASATAQDAEDRSLGVSNDAPEDFSLGMTTVTFSAGDACGMTATGSARVTIQIEAFCGDGNRDADEACDDGNNLDGDGCAADCTLEIPPEPVPDDIPGDIQADVEVKEVDPGQVNLTVEFDEMVELETLICGPEGGALVPPLSKEIEIEHDETEVKALFATPDDQCGTGTSFVCQGYLADGRSFMGTSEQFQTECKDDGGERDEDDGHDERDKHDNRRGGWKAKLKKWLW
jgi:cysteine-rich repeat protein